MKYIIGIDEVGRGPLAGPVTVCVVACEENLYKKLKLNKNLPVSGRDSKKIKEKNRGNFSKILYELKKDGKILFSINHVSNKIIDKSGISFSIKKAIAAGIKNIKLVPQNSTFKLDGGLKAPVEFKQKTIIKGDEKEKIIAWASILAKVSRDNLMKKKSKQFPGYGFEIHKGYGTQGHRNSIKRYGVSTFHRSTFCKNIRILKKA